MFTLKHYQHNLVLLSFHVSSHLSIHPSVQLSVWRVTQEDVTSDSLLNWPLEFEFDQTNIQMWKTHIGVWKNNWGKQSKMVFKICEGILCSSFCVKKFDVIVHKKYIPCITLLDFWPFVPQITSETSG